VFGQPITYTAPRTPPGGTGRTGQLRPGGPQLIERPPTVSPERLAMLDTIAAHNALVRADIEKYGRNRAATIGQNAELIDAALEARKVRQRGAPSLAGQTAHLTSSINLMSYLGGPIQMPVTYDDGSPVDPAIAGKVLPDPFTVLTKSPWYATFGKKVPILGEMAGPSWWLDIAEGKGDPRAKRVNAYAGAVQSIVKGLGDVGNLSEGEQRTVADRLLPSGNTTEWAARGRQKQLVEFLSVVRDGLLAVQKRGGTNVDGANVLRQAAGLAPIDAWSVERDNSRQGIQGAPNVIGATPPAEPNTIGTTEAPQ